MKTKEQILAKQHWQLEGYRQRIAAKDWRCLLLNDDDKIIFEGRVRKFTAKSLGSGVVEVSKAAKDGR